MTFSLLQLMLVTGWIALYCLCLLHPTSLFANSFAALHNGLFALAVFVAVEIPSRSRCFLSVFSCAFLAGIPTGYALTNMIWWYDFETGLVRGTSYDSFCEWVFFVLPMLPIGFGFIYICAITLVATLWVKLKRSHKGHRISLLSWEWLQAGIAVPILRRFEEMPFSWRLLIAIPMATLGIVMAGIGILAPMASSAEIEFLVPNPGQTTILILGTVVVADGLRLAYGEWCRFVTLFVMAIAGYFAAVASGISEPFLHIAAR
ncbi:MAG: hypothetical protein R3E01_35605 [Pirellulaceae bacterium]|nr:hypothetical protein [Planctomycetales bacterium]